METGLFEKKNVAGLFNIVSIDFVSPSGNHIPPPSILFMLGWLNGLNLTLISYNFTIIPVKLSVNSLPNHDCVFE